MAYYLVQAKLIPGLTEKLYEMLNNGEIRHMHPFGQALHFSLENARLQEDGIAVWEEEDYCNPPLAQERAAVLNHFFENISVERVEKGTGWKQIVNIPGLWNLVESLQRDPAAA